MTSQLLDRLERRVNNLIQLVGPWNPTLENQENILTSISFLEKSTESIYSNTFHINEQLFQIIDQYVLRNEKPLNLKEIQDIDYKISLYNSDMNLMNEKLKQLDDIYVNKFLKNVDIFNDMSSRQFLDHNTIIEQYKKLRKLITQQEELAVKSMKTLRKFVDYCLKNKTIS